MGSTPQARMRGESTSERQVLVQLQVLDLPVSVLREAGSGQPLLDQLLKSSGEQPFVRFGGHEFAELIEQLRRDGKIRVLAEPALVTASGSPVVFEQGGGIPAQVPPSAVAPVGIKYREVGTRVRCRPLVLGAGRLRLELKPTVTQLRKRDRGGSSGGTLVQEFDTWTVETAFEMQVGQTAYLAGPATAEGQAEASERLFLVMVRPEFVSATKTADAE